MAQQSAENIDVICKDGSPGVHPKDLYVAKARGATVINWLADNTVTAITRIEFVNNPGEFDDPHPLNPKHWQCLDKNTTPGDYEYRLWAICEGSDEEKEADPFIHNQP